MNWSPSTLYIRGYDVVHGAGADTAIIDELQLAGCYVDRDVIIDSVGCGELVACPGNFAHHTDGVFLPVPPRWMIVQVVRADAGGGLHVLDASPLAAEGAGGRIWFGTEQSGVLARVVSWIEGRPCIRYRADYMHGYDDPDALAGLHSRVAALITSSSVRLGELPTGSCLVTDNWRVLHRREAFTGERVIRRCWLTEKPT